MPDPVAVAPAVVVPPPAAPKPNAVMTFLGSQGFHSFYHAALSGGVGYITAHGIAPSAQWYSGLAAAVLGGIVGWLNGGQS